MSHRTSTYAAAFSFSLVLLFGAIASPVALAQERPIKIAVVDLERLVAQSTPGQALQARLEKFQETVQAEGEQKAQKAREIRQKATDGGSTLSQADLADLQKQYEDATLEIRRFREEKQREGERIRNEGLREIEKQMEPVFRQIRDAGSYDLILNNIPGVVVMANERVDITQMVIERFNAAQQ